MSIEAGESTCVEVLFLGDTCFGASYKGPRFRKRGFDFAFEHLDGLLARADLVVANLETVLTRETSSVLKGRKRWVHRDEPAAAAALKDHGIDVVSLGNNHAFDYGTPGLVETLGALDDAGIDAIGAGLTEAAAARPFVRDLPLGQGVFRLGITACKQYTDYGYPYHAELGHAGPYGVRRRTAAAQIRRLRKAEPSAFIVAFPHWGPNYRWRTRYQGKLARSMVRAGADLVIGHGAHCLQEIDRIDDRWVLYSIGNFIFHTPGRFNAYPEMLPFSTVAQLRVTDHEDRPSVTLRLYPILSDNRQTNYVPRFATSEELEQIRVELVSRSNEEVGLAAQLVGDTDEFGPFLELPVHGAAPPERPPLPDEPRQPT